MKEGGREGARQGGRECKGVFSESGKESKIRKDERSEIEIGEEGKFKENTEI